MNQSQVITAVIVVLVILVTLSLTIWQNSPSGGASVNVVTVRSPFTATSTTVNVPETQFVDLVVEGNDEEWNTLLIPKWNNGTPGNAVCVQNITVNGPTDNPVVPNLDLNNFQLLTFATPFAVVPFGTFVTFRIAFPVPITEFSFYFNF